jgi:hypothetical protein
MDNVSISGVVERAKVREIQLTLQGYIPGAPAHTSTYQLDENNKFSFVAYVREPVYGQIFYGKDVIPFYVEPGARLQISFNGKDVSNTINFAGDLRVENQFLTDYTRHYQLSYNALQDNVRRLSPEEYIEWANQRRDAQTRHLMSQENLSETFREMELSDIEYGWANELYEYGSLRSASNRKKYELPDGFYNFADNIRLHNYEVISLESYRTFLRNYLDYYYQLIYQGEPSDDSLYYNHMYKVAQQNLRSKPRYHMQAEYLTEAITYLGLDAVADEYIEFANECPVQEYKNQLHELIKMQNVFEEAKPVVTFTTNDGQQLKLDDLKGNIVLVRFDNESSFTEQGQERDQLLRQELRKLGSEVTFLRLSMKDNRKAYESLVYADANEYLKSIINRPKPGQKVELPAWSYVVLNKEGLVVSNSLDDPNNELAIEKVKLFLSMDQ